MSIHRISILGTGDLGGAIATAIARRSRHSLALRGATPDSVTAAALIAELAATKATDAEIAASHIVFVVVPAKSLTAAAELLQHYRGIVVSVSVSGTVGLGGKQSSAETLAALLPQARVVNAFSFIWSTVARNPGAADKTSVFLCSDDNDAKATVGALAEELGFDTVNAGTLATAVYAEALGMFAVRLALDQGYGQTISFRAFKAH